MNQSVSTAVDTRSMVIIALMVGVTCILGPLAISIPISPVPISLTNLAVYFAVYVLGMKRGTFSYCLYLLIGLIGLPVFSGFTGGPGKLLGPTGGYLIGFVFMAVCCGFFVEKSSHRAIHIAGMIVGTAVCYLFGTAWLAHLTGMTFQAALGAGVIPFIPGDLAKIIIAAAAGPVLRSRLRQAGLE